MTLIKEIDCGTPAFKTTKSATLTSDGANVTTPHRTWRISPLEARGLFNGRRIEVHALGTQRSRGWKTTPAIETFRIRRSLPRRKDQCPQGSMPPRSEAFRS
jgi:hypothetical protein